MLLFVGMYAILCSAYRLQRIHTYTRYQYTACALFSSACHHFFFMSDIHNICHTDVIITSHLSLWAAGIASCSSKVFQFPTRKETFGCSHTMFCTIVHQLQAALLRDLKSIAICQVVLWCMALLDSSPFTKMKLQKQRLACLFTC